MISPSLSVLSESFFRLELSFFSGAADLSAGPSFPLVAEFSGEQDFRCAWADRSRGVCAAFAIGASL